MSSMGLPGVTASGELSPADFVWIASATSASSLTASPPLAAECHRADAGTISRRLGRHFEHRQTFGLDAADVDTEITGDGISGDAAAGRSSVIA